LSNTFKIRPDKVRYVALADLRNQGIMFLIVNVITFGYLLWLAKEANIPIYIFTIAFIFTLLIEFGLLLYLYNFKISYYSNYCIAVDDQFLYKKIALEETDIKDGFIKFAWHRNKLLSNQTDIQINWDKIKNLKMESGGVLVISSEHNERIFVPYYTENFQELDNFIKTKIKVH
jgi:hypothetical protein